MNRMKIAVLLLGLIIGAPLIAMDTSKIKTKIKNTRVLITQMLNAGSRNADYQARFETVCNKINNNNEAQDSAVILQELTAIWDGWSARLRNIENEKDRISALITSLTDAAQKTRFTDALNKLCDDTDGEKALEQLAKITDTDSLAAHLTIASSKGCGILRPRYLMVAAGCVSCGVLIYRYFRSQNKKETQRDVEQPEQEASEGAA